jgi:hypothetical protein
VGAGGDRARGQRGVAWILLRASPWRARARRNHDV